ncbi:MAG: branched-chain amino acid transaminase [Burkholderiaceae bacterium]
MWKARQILVNGELMPFEQASVHPLSLAMAYATTVFEGIRAYHQPDTGEFFLFRLDDHLRRLGYGMKVMRMNASFSRAQLATDINRVIRANEPDDDVYLRLLVYVEAIGMLATSEPIGYTIAAIPRERPTTAKSGVSLGVSSWSRLPDNASPPRIKATANYHNARLTQLQAKADGYDGALMLTPSGKVSEAPIACFFMVRDGQLITPGVTSNILESITRDTIIRLHEEAGGTVVQRDVDRSELYLAEEAFICGTGQEILPVTAVDKLPVGNGAVGPITQQLQQQYFDTVRFGKGGQPQWRTLVPAD